jgi:ubiquinone/menaquinone biosynthesis C-methylase UbiE
LNEKAGLSLSAKATYLELSNDQPPVCDYEGSDYQTSFWERGERFYEDQVEEIALKRLLPASGKLLLELGAGAGRNTPRYAGFERIVLLDYSRTQLRQAQERLGRDYCYIYVAANIYKLPFVSGLFDAATMIRTLHHMSNPLLALRQVQRTLQPGAVFVLEFANKQNLKAIARFALGRQDWSPFSLEPVEFAKLNFDFHPRAIRGWLKESGFNVQRQLTVSHFRSGWVKKHIPLHLLVGMDSLTQLTGNWWQLTPSVFVKATADPAGAKVVPSGFFQCPECNTSDLEKKENLLICQNCGCSWRCEDGIYDFRKPVN